MNARLWQASLLALISLLATKVVFGCSSSVAYVGTVTEAVDEDAGYAFDTVPNEGGRPPIEGALLSLCTDPSCQSVSDDAGEWGPVSESFPPFGGNREISVTVQAPGYAPFVYSTQYPNTADSLNASQFLDVWLKKQNASAAIGDASPE